MKYVSKVGTNVAIWGDLLELKADCSDDSALLQGSESPAFY